MQTPPSVIDVTETWINDATSKLANITGYNFFSNHRISESGVRVGIYLKMVFTLNFTRNVIFPTLR